MEGNGAASGQHKAKIQYPLEKIKNAEIREDDIFLITFPKSGTHLLRYMMLLLLSDGEEDAATVDGRCVLLEIALVEDGDDPVAEAFKSRYADTKGVHMETLSSPRFFASHLSYNLLPRQIEEKRPKVIYVARNPKDLLVSFLNMRRKMPEFTLYPITLESVVDTFVDGSFNPFDVEDYGSWHEHVLAWWAKKDAENVLFMKYEDITRNMKDNLRLLARFLGKNVSDEVIDKIANLCSIESMRKSAKARNDALCECLGIPTTEHLFVNKGQVGGWKKHFTVAQSKRLDEAYRSWMMDSDLEFDFE
ncbi:sulfotransferase 1C4-like isoform X1 [Ptychodera flava]|uniref:sulfotransferase 1C4-like isoform X1 n=1 Tax=Ptychodera flava TaxID=63121 RepID=UPI00396A269A